jgi:hypothetical protein
VLIATDDESDSRVIALVEIKTEDKIYRHNISRYTGNEVEIASRFKKSNMKVSPEQI